jgi:hypothetical protein
VIAVLAVPSHRLTIAGIAAPAVVDVPMLSRGPEPAVEVMVNGRGPFLFAIDTGATDDARVDSSLVQLLQLRITGTDTGDDGSGKDTVRVGTVVLESLSIGGLEFRRVKAGTRDFNRIGLPHIDGMLTFDLFHDYLFTLDYLARRVRLERGALPDVDGAEILRLKRVHHHPAVDLVIGKQRVTAEIDSGNVGWEFLFPATLMKTLSLATAPRDAGKARTVTHEIDMKEAQLLENIALGRFSFSRPLVGFPAPFPFANVGSLILSQFAVTFDQRHNRVRFIQRQ